MMTKQLAHKVFLLISAAIILHGASGYIFINGIFSTMQLDSYTILSNLLVAFGFILMAIFSNRQNALWSYLSFAMLVCICFTGLVYNLVLTPFGGHEMVFLSWPNFVTHLLAMVLVIVNYVVFEKKGTFTRKHIILAGLLPTILYWAIFVFFGEQLNFGHYFFMMPSLIGWSMVYFWFVLLMIFFIGLSMTIMLFDNGRKFIAIAPLILGATICLVLGTLFYTPIRILLIISIPVEDVRVQDRIEFSFVPSRSGYHTIDLSFEGDGIITFFELSDENAEVGTVFTITEEHFSNTWNLRLWDNPNTVRVIFFTDYDSLIHFIESEEFSPELSTHLMERSEHYKEVFSRGGANYSAHFSITIQESYRRN